jgi:tRNA splicing endonuclease
MLLEKSYSESNITPMDLEVKHLGGNLYEITKNENVETVEKSQEGITETFYNCDKTILRSRITSRDEAIVAFIRLKYSQNDEFALTNKGIANSQDTEYLVYRDYVAWCKEQASVYFS